MVAFNSFGLATAALLSLHSGLVNGADQEPLQQATEQCDTICHQLRDPHNTGSLGDSIGRSIHRGDGDIMNGRQITTGPCGREPSTAWYIWAKSLGLSWSTGADGLYESGLPEDRICVDRTLLARVTAAAARCHSAHHGLGDYEEGSYDSGFDIHSGGKSGDNSIHTPDTGGQAPADNAGHSGFGTGNTNPPANPPPANSPPANPPPATGGGAGTTSRTGWGSGNVNDNSICFRIKDKQSDRYLNTGGSEYAFAYYDSYYSVFRAYPSKTVAGGYTIREINRNGAKMNNIPVKLNSATGAFQPGFGTKDAIWTFNPAMYGDSCWGVPGKKMSRRHDWTSWGENYRQSSTGEECADVELEEADC